MAVHLANPQNLNTYSYVLNNPLKYIDPDGEYAFLGPLLAAVPPVLAALSTALPYIPAYISNWQDTLRVAPGSSDIIDAQQFITGQDSFTGSQLSPLSRGFSGIGLLPFISGGMVKGAANVLPDAAIVVKGGADATSEMFRKSIGIHPSGLKGFSVESAADLDICTLCKNIPHNQIRTSTVGDIRNAGGDVIPTSGRSSNHATVTNLRPEIANKVFSLPIDKPTRR